MSQNKWILCQIFLFLIEIIFLGIISVIITYQLHMNGFIICVLFITYNYILFLYKTSKTYYLKNMENLK